MIPRGTVVVANRTITAGLQIPEILCFKGRRLVVDGYSTNGIHALSVFFEDDPARSFAVSEHEIDVALPD